MAIVIIKVWLVILCFLAITKNSINLQNLKKEYNENKYLLSKKIKKDIKISLRNFRTPLFFILTVICLFAEMNLFTLSVIVFLYGYFLYIIYAEKKPIFKKIDKVKKKNSIISLSKSVEDNLTIFADSSQFKIRVLNALSVIKEINFNNMKLKSTIKDKGLKDEVVLNEKHLLKSLKKILKLLIKYNNERNELILEEINKNIEILNKIKGELQ